MVENCTIYCKIVNLDEIARLLDLYFPSSRQSAGEAMTVHGSDGSLRLTQGVFREPGDDFCRMMLGIRAFVKRLESANASSKQTVIDHLDHSDLAIGVVAEPAFDADERYHAVVFAIANALDGVVFNGQEMLDASGVTLVAVT